MGLGIITNLDAMCSDDYGWILDHATAGITYQLYSCRLSTDEKLMFQTGLYHYENGKRISTQPDPSIIVKDGNIVSMIVDLYQYTITYYIDGEEIAKFIGIEKELKYYPTLFLL